MYVGDALADAVVHRDERPLGSEPLLHRLRHQLHARQQRRAEVRREVGKRLVMLARDEKGMPREQRPVVEKAERSVIFIDDRRLALTLDDLAELAGHPSIVKESFFRARTGEAKGRQQHPSG